MRLGRVVLNMGYVVDLDNDDMVIQAREALYSDIMSLVKYDEIGESIETVEDSSLKKEQIPDFLTEDHTDYLEDILEKNLDNSSK